MKAINDYIVIEKEKVGPKKVAGLIMTEKTDVDNRYLKATIISVGNFVEGLKEGDVIYYDKNNGSGVRFNDKMYYVIRSRDVVLVE